MLRTKKGPGGGYSLSRPPKEIRIGHVIRTLDGPLAPLQCASKSAYSPCPDRKDSPSCAVQITMSKVRDAIPDILDQMTLEEMVIYSRVKNPDLMYYI